MSGLKIAASNIGWSRADDARVLARMAELGFSGLEVAPTRVFEDEPYSRKAGFAKWAADVEAEHGLSVCSMQSIWRGRAESIFDGEGAAALLAYTGEACAFAEAGHVGNLVFGCPGNRSVPQGRGGSEAAPFIEACGSLAAASGAVFALEANPPMYGTNFLNTTTEVADFLDAMGEAPGLGLNLDVGAMVCAGEGADVAERVFRHISHVHVSEPGLAPVEARRLHRELRAVLEDYGYDGYVSLEMRCVDFGTVSGCLEYLAEAFLG